MSFSQSNLVIINNHSAAQPRPCSLVGSVQVLRTGGRRFDPMLVYLFPRIDGIHPDRINSSLSADYCLTGVMALFTHTHTHTHTRARVRARVLHRLILVEIGIPMRSVHLSTLSWSYQISFPPNILFTALDILPHNYYPDSGQR